MPAIKGHCACGAVSYESSAEAPAFAGVCHCKDCQRHSGSAFNVVVAVPVDTLAIEGELTTYESKGDSGKSVFRKFCPKCGSTITSEPEAIPGLSIIRVGTLDDTSWVKPAMEIYCEAAQPWVSLGGEMQKFPKMPG
jgi:hypothetical protein